MRHVRSDEMASTQRSVERQLSSKDASGDYASELPGVVAGRGRMGSTHAKEVKHRGLGFENGAAADCADFYRGHRHGDLEVAIDATDS